MPIKSYHRISFCISPTTATSKQRTKISGPWSAHTRWPGVHSKWYDLHLLKVIWLRPSLGAKQGREPNQPQALQYPKDKIKDFWRESTTISRDYHLKENAPSQWPHTQLGHWELEPPQHIRNLLSTLHYLDVTVPLSCLLPSALFRPTLPHALIVHCRSFWKDPPLPGKAPAEDWCPKSLWILPVSPSPRLLYVILIQF